MSQEDVEHTRRGLEDFRRTREALWAELRPNCELHDHDLADATIHRGHDGWREWVAHYEEAWGSVALEPQEYAAEALEAAGLRE